MIGKPKRKYFAFLFVAAFCLLALACSARTTNSTWEANFNYSPSPSPTAKADTPLISILGDLYLYMQLSSGISVGCNAGNEWAAMDAKGGILPEPPAPPELPYALEEERGLLVMVCPKGTYLWGTGIHGFGD